MINRESSSSHHPEKIIKTVNSCQWVTQLYTFCVSLFAMIFKAKTTKRNEIDGKSVSIAISAQHKKRLTQRLLEVKTH